MLKCSLNIKEHFLNVVDWDWNNEDETSKQSI